MKKIVILALAVLIGTNAWAFGGSGSGRVPSQYKRKQHGVDSIGVTIDPDDPIEPPIYRECDPETERLILTKCCPNEKVYNEGAQEKCCDATGYALRDGVCQRTCPSGLVFDGEECVDLCATFEASVCMTSCRWQTGRGIAEPSDTICGNNMHCSGVDARCVCDDTFIAKDANNCVCPEGLVEDKGRCVCTEEYNLSEGDLDLTAYTYAVCEDDFGKHYKESGCPEGWQKEVLDGLMVCFDDDQQDIVDDGDALKFINKRSMRVNNVLIEMGAGSWMVVYDSDENIFKVTDYYWDKDRVRSVLWYAESLEEVENTPVKTADTVGAWNKIMRLFAIKSAWAADCVRPGTCGVDWSKYRRSVECVAHGGRCQEGTGVNGVDCVCERDCADGIYLADKDKCCTGVHDSYGNLDADCCANAGGAMIMNIYGSIDCCDANLFSLRLGRKSLESCCANGYDEVAERCCADDEERRLNSLAHDICCPKGVDAVHATCCPTDKPYACVGHVGGDDEWSLIACCPDKDVFVDKYGHCCQQGEVLNDVGECEVCVLIDDVCCPSGKVAEKDGVRTCCPEGYESTSKYDGTGGSMCCPKGTGAINGECCPSDKPYAGVGHVGGDDEWSFSACCPDKDVFVDKYGHCCQRGELLNDVGECESVCGASLVWDNVEKACVCPDGGELGTDGETCCKDGYTFIEASGDYAYVDEARVCGCPEDGQSDGNACCKDGYWWGKSIRVNRDGEIPHWGVSREVGAGYNIATPSMCGCPMGWSEAEGSRNVCCQDGLILVGKDDNGEEIYEFDENSVCCPTGKTQSGYWDQNGGGHFNCCESGLADGEGNCCDKGAVLMRFGHPHSNKCCPSGKVAEKDGVKTCCGEDENLVRIEKPSGVTYGMVCCSDATEADGDGNCCPNSKGLSPDGTTYVCCGEDQVVVNDECKPKCREDQVRNEAGECVCAEDQEEVTIGDATTCKPKCREDQVRNEAGECVCAEDQEEVTIGDATTCKPTCSGSQQRNAETGECETMCDPSMTWDKENGKCICPEGQKLVDNETSGWNYRPQICCPEGSGGSVEGECCPTGQSPEYKNDGTDELMCCPEGSGGAANGKCCQEGEESVPANDGTDKSVCCPFGAGAANGECCEVGESGAYKNDGTHEYMCCPKGRARAGFTCCDEGEWATLKNDGTYDRMCCPEGTVAANGVCCAEGEEAIDGVCCPSTRVAKQNGVKTCCGSDETPIDGVCCANDKIAEKDGTKICCGDSEKAIGSTCCPSDKVAERSGQKICCGSDETVIAGACCANDKIAEKDGTKTCCGSDETPIDGVCCSNDDVGERDGVKTCGCNGSDVIISKNDGTKMCCNVWRGECCEEGEWAVPKYDGSMAGICCPWGRPTAGGKCCEEGEEAIWVGSKPVECCPSDRVAEKDGVKTCCSSDEEAVDGECCASGKVTEKDGVKTCCAEWEEVVDGVCCPSDRIVEQNGERFCCPAGRAIVAGKCCAEDEEAVDNMCCPPSRIAEQNGEKTCCQSWEMPVATNDGTNNTMCCPAGQEAIYTTNNAFGYLICCPIGRGAVNGECCAEGEEAIDGECCPSTRVGERYGVKACCYNDETLIDGECCQFYRVRKQDGEPFCCPEDEIATDDGVCCRTDRIVDQDGMKICCGVGERGTYKNDGTYDMMCCPEGLEAANGECCKAGEEAVFANDGSGKYMCCPIGADVVNGECVS